MSEVSKKVNRFFKTATKSEVLHVQEEVCLDEFQNNIFTMFYIGHKDIGFIADTLGYSVSRINNELNVLRARIIKLI